MSQVFLQKPVIVGPLLQLVSKLNYRGVDMHFHTEYSMDGVSKIKIMLEELGKKGIGVAITDHNEIQGVIKAMEQNSGQFIIPGIELTCNTGVHLVLYFPEISVLEKFFKKEILPLKKKNPFFLPISLEKMLQVARKYDCYTSAPHPFGPGVIGIMKEGGVKPSTLRSIDMIEAVNGSCFKHQNKKAIAWAKEVKKGMSAGSDGHTSAQLGKVLCFSYGKNPRDFLESIKKGNSLCIGTRENLFEEIVHTAEKFVREERTERGQLLKLYRSRYQTEHDYLLYKIRKEEGKIFGHFHLNHKEPGKEHHSFLKKHKEYKQLLKKK